MLRENLTGQTFGRLTVIGFDHSKDKTSYWKCKCICGNEKIVQAQKLKSGNTQSCGCLQKESRYGRNLSNLIGMKFGRLTVIERAENDNRGKVQWLCRCDCGNTNIVRSYALKSGRTKSCGCYASEQKKERNSTHHLTYHRIYKIWENMKSRCKNPNTNNFKDYGGRGITICQEWLDDFMQFYNWAMKNGYNDTLTIDRIDTNGNYEPSNCRWANRVEQGNNKRNNCLLTYNNETHTIMEWVRKTGLSKNTIRGRLKRGWSIEKTLTTHIMADSIQILTPKE